MKLGDRALQGALRLAPPRRHARRKHRRAQTARRPRRYLLRTNLTESDPAQLWQYYIQLVAVDIDQSWQLSKTQGWKE